MTEAQLEIATAFAADFAWKAKRRGVPLAVDELKAAGLYGAAQAWRTFDPSKGSWSTHCYTRVWGAVRDRVRKEVGKECSEPRPGMMSLDAPLSTAEDACLYDCLPNQSAWVEPRDDALDRLLSYLWSKVRRSSVSALQVYLHGKHSRDANLRALADSEGVTEAAISHRAKMALKDMREAAQHLTRDQVMI